jgi:epoxyqueuosine reductase
LDKKTVTADIKTAAKNFGFEQVGISKAEFMSEEASRLEVWLNNNHHGEMSYLENHFDKRVDPTKLVPGAKSVISLTYNYYPSETQEDTNAPKIAKYAYGRDYHKVVRKKLKHFLHYIRENHGDVQGRCFVDSAPVLERDWAKRAGLGWIGKHTLLINKNRGSFFFLAELIIDLELEYDHPVTDHCGTCTKCIDACPTDAIKADGFILDSSKCISYLTIELKNDIPESFKGKMADWMFGCDICQDVCPWNRFAKSHIEPDFNPKAELMTKSKSEWEDITEDIFDKLFEGSAVKRTKFEGLKRNIRFLNS